MLARVLAMALWLFVRPSVCHKSAFCRKGWTDWSGFWLMGFFLSVLPCLCGIPPKIKVLPFWTLPQTLDLENFARAYRSLTYFEKDGRPEREKLDRRRSVKLRYPELRQSTASFSHWSSSSVYSTFPSRGSISDSWYSLCAYFTSLYLPFLRCTSPFNVK